MYQHDHISSRETSSPALMSEIDLMIGHTGGIISLHRLRSAVAEIFSALSETLRVNVHPRWTRDRRPIVTRGFPGFQL